MSPAAPKNDIAVAIADLGGTGIDGLRAEWRRRFGEPPSIRSGDFLRRLLAERIQVEAYGGDPTLDRELDRLARAYDRGEAPRFSTSRFKAGTVLVREHAGQVHRVEVVAAGFLWNGQAWKSLSEVARQITGVRWNGPRFFGLREAVAKS